MSELALLPQHALAPAAPPGPPQGGAARRTNNSAPERCSLQGEAAALLQPDPSAPFRFSLAPEEVTLLGGCSAAEQHGRRWRLLVGQLLRGSEASVGTLFATLTDGFDEDPEKTRVQERLLTDSLLGLDEPLLERVRPTVRLELNRSGWLAPSQQRRLSTAARCERCVSVSGRDDVLHLGEVEAAADVGSARVHVSWPGAGNFDGITPKLLVSRLSGSRIEVRGVSYLDERCVLGTFRADPAAISELFNPDQAGDVAGLLARNLPEARCNVPELLQRAVGQFLTRHLRLAAMLAAGQPEDAASHPPLVVDRMHLRAVGPGDVAADGAKVRKQRYTSLVVALSPSTAKCVCAAGGLAEPHPGDSRVYVEFGCCGGELCEDGRCGAHAEPLSVFGRDAGDAVGNPPLAAYVAANGRVSGVCRQCPFLKVYGVHSDRDAPPCEGAVQCPTHVIVGRPGAAARANVEPAQFSPLHLLFNVPDAADFFLDILGYMCKLARAPRHSDQRLKLLEREFLAARRRCVDHYEALRPRRLADPGAKASLDSLCTPPDELALLDRRAAAKLREGGYESQLKRKSPGAQPGGQFNVQLCKRTRREGGGEERRGSRSCADLKLSRTHAHLFPNVPRHRGA